jgi:NTE family protein
VARRAFVLSGGASLGAIQVGMLRALFERGIGPDLIIGTSAGAINGAYIASRDPTPGTADALGEIWRGLRRSTIFPANPLTGFIGFIGRSDHLVPDSGLRRLIRAHLEIARLEQARVPLHVIATDVLSGAERRLSRGPAVDAVMASAAIPGVFAPVQWEGRALMDGGVSNDAAISHAIQLGAEDVYILPTGFACALSEPPRSALAMLLHSMSLLVKRRLLRDVELLGDRARLIVLPPPCPQRVQPIDFGRAVELIQDSLTASRAFLDSRETADPSASLRAQLAPLLPHEHRSAAESFSSL